MCHRGRSPPDAWVRPRRLIRPADCAICEFKRTQHGETQVRQCCVQYLTSFAELTVDVLVAQCGSRALWTRVQDEQLHACELSAAFTFLYVHCRGIRPLTLQGTAVHCTFCLFTPLLFASPPITRSTPQFVTPHSSVLRFWRQCIA